jgi:hypothetical protein
MRRDIVLSVLKDNSGYQHWIYASTDEATPKPPLPDRQFASLIEGGADRSAICLRDEENIELHRVSSSWDSESYPPPHTLGRSSSHCRSAITA